MKKSIFVADSHLKSPSAPEYRDFLTFLDNVVLPDFELDAFFILGDLFDFFVGFPQVIFYEHMEVLFRLNKLAERGVKIFYFEGNHDFFLKKLNRHGLPVVVVEKAMDVQLDGKFYVSHGDLVNKRDFPHRILSFILRNPLINLFAYVLPPYLVYEFAHFFSRFSRKNISSKRIFSENILRDFVLERIGRGYSGAILGHFHKNMTLKEKDNDKNFTTYLLGCWKDDRSYLVFENRQFNGYIFDSK